MSQKFLNFNKVSFSYDSMHAPLIADMSYSFPPGWYAIAGANGTGKTTFLKLASAIIMPDSGTVTIPGSVYYCEQRTDTPPEISQKMFDDNTGSAENIMQKLGVQRGWFDNWQMLSHGERKRFQLACALWMNPDVLCVDEPFNHLDALAKQAVVSILKGYPGIGLLVSHDRETSDELCRGCLIFDGNRITAHNSGISDALVSLENINASKKKKFMEKQRGLRRMSDELTHRKNKAMQADSKRSKKHLDRHDSDGRARIDLARLTGKDAVAGRLQKQMENRVLRAADELGRIDYIKEKKHVIFLPGCKSRRNYIFKTERYVIDMGGKTLVIPRLILDTGEKVAVTGSNGSGKSTFINFMMQGINTEEGHICYIPQEITKVQSDKIWMQIRAMKGADLGRVLVIISNLGSDPKQLLQSVSPSPGETRKLMLAMGIMKTPHIIVMDEPTNHMDIISIQCLEAALKECPCAVVLVSHDIKFLNAITDKIWHIECRGNQSLMLTETQRTGFNDVMKG